MDAKPMSRPAQITGTALLALAGLVACDGAQKDRASSPESTDAVKSNEVCEGILSEDAAQALDYVTGVDEYLDFSPGDGLKGTVEKISGSYDPRRVDGTLRDARICLIYKSETVGLPDLEISFSLSETKEIGGDKPSFVRYPVGREALANSEVAILYSECVSSKMPGSKANPALIRGELRNKAEPDGDAEKLRRANLTILNSAALELAKGLECKNDAGLSGKPQLSPQAE